MYLVANLNTLPYSVDINNLEVGSRHGTSDMNKYHMTVTAVDTIC